MSSREVLAAWSATSAADKVALTLQLADLCAAPEAVELGLTAGRPHRPELVVPQAVRRRGIGSREGHLALLHAIAHIEFNAINLALDAVLRFGAGMPLAFSNDWLSVARDEARHFRMLAARLQSFGCSYGELPAHNGLWEAAEKTAADVLARMALVPRVLEARGLDVTPGMIARLQKLGAVEDVRVLQIILREEVRHVALGSYWYRRLCAQRSLDPASTFRQLLSEHMPGRRGKGPFNHAARAAAGLRPEEYAF